MKNIVLKTGIAFALAALLSSLGLVGSDVVLQSLFTVLGISFSITVSILISFDLSDVFNKPVRDSIRNNIHTILNLVVWDFFISIIAFVTGLFVGEGFTLETGKVTWLKLNVSVFSAFILVFSLLYELHKFINIQKLKDELTDKIMDEKANRQR